MDRELIVRHTFIDAVDDDEDEGTSLGDYRTMSDPTGRATKQVIHLGRPDSLRVDHHGGGSSTIHEDVHAEAAAIAEDDDGSRGKQGVPEGEDEDEDDDEDDDSPLERTTTHQVWPGDVYDGASTKSGPVPGGSGRGIALFSLLPADEASSGASAGAAAAAKGEGGEADASAVDAVAIWQYQAAMAAAANPWAMNPWAYYGDYSQMYHMPFAAGAEGEGEEGATRADWRSGQLPPIGSAPPFGILHSFHQEASDMGTVTPDFRQFTKVGYEGRLSVVSESQVHTDGVQRFLVQFSAGDLSRADGVGFVFSPRLPCAKNIQRIVSIFVNQRGQICMRLFAEIIRASAHVKALEVGDWVEMIIDLDKRNATFNVWQCSPGGWPTGRATSTAEFPYGTKLGRLNQTGSKPVKLNVGHLACVVKNPGVTVTLAS